MSGRGKPLVVGTPGWGRCWAGAYHSEIFFSLAFSRHLYDFNDGAIARCAGRRLAVPPQDDRLVLALVCVSNHGGVLPPAHESIRARICTRHQRDDWRRQEPSSTGI